MAAVPQKLWGFEMVTVHAVDEWRFTTMAHGKPSVTMAGMSMMPMWRAVSWDFPVLIVSHAKQAWVLQVRWKGCSVKETKIRWEIVFTMIGVWETVVMDTLESYVLVCWDLFRHLPWKVYLEVPLPWISVSFMNSVPNKVFDLFWFESAEVSLKRNVHKRKSRTDTTWLTLYIMK